MPKSTNTSFQPAGSAPAGAGRTKRLPGWGSAWKKPSSKICFRYLSISRAATALRRMPAASMAAKSVILIAPTSSRVSTRRVVWLQITAGTRTSGVPLEGGREALGVPPLVQVVDLLPQRAAELLDQGRHVGVPAHGAEAGQPAAHHPQRGEVRLHDLADVGALHLDHHRRAGASAAYLPGRAAPPSGDRAARCAPARWRRRPAARGRARRSTPPGGAPARPRAPRGSPRRARRRPRPAARPARR